MLNIQTWKHVFKLDPDKLIGDEELEMVCESGTDAIIVGGTTNVTFDNTIDLLSRIRRYAVPCALEVSNVEAIVPGFDAYFVPLVLNAQNPEWIFNAYIEGLKEHGPFIKWDEVFVEGYIVCNPDSAVARLTESRTNIAQEEMKAYARLADQMLKLPIFYIEYSGIYGDVEQVRAAQKVVQNSRIFYGGGIRSAEQAAEMAQWADTIIVGNIIYENLEQALLTVQAVKKQK
ncbi:MULTISPECIES: heptaprenylglyceryl phosphate synthase [Aneurinibacillus]|uniref:heptaprenylglyceryl phosphate synthase n=1 Tax=Aneurinibacillus TaxID=55079 RepID=UPI000B895CE7|nr:MULTISPECIES: heptaprenylglyceryl phosphate synthase [Aneurinibacillus]MED0676929.1 heptaprenylglyceryl phosphate synthase [Aneurinibacillus thermoaerophilus]MED0681364.1 heptaprenylglyceryl phosphate synthase [Aneurinibacillus thermoaerophilus]MED0738263.1 heptaprenylglyceryl phosphate synthase [Aneurinibacillus thermoaerophilus]MED0757532.1 heptaprenylglyceryl phosphate synthase [Aneurinibacillus thermoaerophilus]MED0760126.1 heptaprenylglyceryl phosphate synthase [Aneurinibacillus thermo